MIGSPPTPSPSSDYHLTTVTMPADLTHHRLIARPPGLPGYAPVRWCAVCGKKAARKSVVDCTAETCPNVAHTSCTGNDTTFDCCEVNALHAALVISASVVFLEAAPDSPQRRRVQLHPVDHRMKLNPPTLILLKYSPQMMMTMKTCCF